jgi:hypothetical protein
MNPSSSHVGGFVLSTASDKCALPPLETDVDAHVPPSLHPPLPLPLAPGRDAARRSRSARAEELSVCREHVRKVDLKG